VRPSSRGSLRGPDLDPVSARRSRALSSRPSASGTVQGERFAELRASVTRAVLNGVGDEMIPVRTPPARREPSERRFLRRTRRGTRLSVPIPGVLTRHAAAFLAPTPIGVSELQRIDAATQGRRKGRMPMVTGARRENASNDEVSSGNARGAPISRRKLVDVRSSRLGHLGSVVGSYRARSRAQSSGSSVGWHSRRSRHRKCWQRRFWPFVAKHASGQMKANSTQRK